MIIRHAELKDSEKIAETHRASIKALCSGYYSTEKIDGWIDLLSPDIYENAIKEKAMILAQEGDNIIGFGILDIENLEIGALYIHPDTKGTGTGKKLLQELEDTARENDADHLALCSTLNAFDFYFYNGYEGREKTFHILPNDIRLECIRMHKSLNGL